MQKHEDIDVLSAKHMNSLQSSRSTKINTLADIMTVNLVLNDRSEIILLHDKQFPFILNWAEFDADLSKLYFISFNGKPIELGVEIPKILHKNILKNTEIKTALLMNDELADFYFLPLINRSIKLGEK